MKRSEMREQAFLLLFEKAFFGEKPCEEIEEIFDENVAPLSEYAKSAFEGACAQLEAVDAAVSSHLKGWRLSRISKVDLAVLRLAVYEIMYEPSVPHAAAVNEAVELAKKYSGAESGSFVNGILRSILRETAQ